MSQREPGLSSSFRIRDPLILLFTVQYVLYHIVIEKLWAPQKKLIKVDRASNDRRFKTECPHSKSFI